MSTNQTRSSELVEEEQKLIVKQGVPRYYETMNQFYDLDLFCSTYLLGIKGIVQLISGYLNEAHMLQEVAGKQLLKDSCPWHRLWFSDRSRFHSTYVYPFKLIFRRTYSDVEHEPDPACSC